jgi:hypothetical protein
MSIPGLLVEFFGSATFAVFICAPIGRRAPIDHEGALVRGGGIQLSKIVVDRFPISLDIFIPIII